MPKYWTFSMPVDKRAEEMLRLGHQVAEAAQKIEEALPRMALALICALDPEFCRDRLQPQRPDVRGHAAGEVPDDQADHSEAEEA